MNCFQGRQHSTHWTSIGTSGALSAMDSALSQDTRLPKTTIISQYRRQFYVGAVLTTLSSKTILSGARHRQGIDATQRKDNDMITDRSGKHGDDNGIVALNIAKQTMPLTGVEPALTTPSALRLYQLDY